MKKIVGVDPGNKNMKCKTSLNDNVQVMPNLLMPVTELNQASSLELLNRSKTQQNPINTLDVSVKSNGTELGRKYVAGMAFRRGANDRMLSKEKYNDSDIIFSTLATTAFNLYMKSQGQTSHDVILGTNLPTYEYINTADECIDKFTSALAGDHYITFHSDFFNGATVHLRMDKSDIGVFPEGTIALLNLMIDPNGNIKPEYENILEAVTIIIDIGGGTTDISAVMNMDIVREFVRAINKGILYPERRIVDTLSARHRGYKITTSELDYCIREKNSQVRYKDTELDIKDLVQTEFTLFANEIASEVNAMIETAPEIFKSKIAKILITGGSASLLGEYVEEALCNNYDCVISPTSLFDNVLGAYNMMANKVKAEKELEAEGLGLNEADTEVQTA